MLAPLAHELHHALQGALCAKPGPLPWHAVGGDGPAPARVLAPLVHDILCPLWGMLCAKLGTPPPTTTRTWLAVGRPLDAPRMLALVTGLPHLPPLPHPVVVVNRDPIVIIIISAYDVRPLGGRHHLKLPRASRPHLFAGCRLSSLVLSFYSHRGLSGGVHLLRNIPGEFGL